MKIKHYTIVREAEEIKVRKEEEKIFRKSPGIGEQIENWRKLDTFTFWNGNAGGFKVEAYIATAPQSSERHNWPFLLGVHYGMLCPWAPQC